MSIAVSIPTVTSQVPTVATSTTTSSVAAAIQDATVRFLREVYLPKIVDLAHERKGDLTVDELAKILGETHISPPTRTVSVPTSTVSTTSTASMPTPSLVSAASNVGMASGSTCMHIGTRGNVKGTQCPRPRVAGTNFCSSHKNSVMARNMTQNGSSVSTGTSTGSTSSAPILAASMQEEAQRMLQQLLGGSS